MDIGTFTFVLGSNFLTITALVAWLRIDYRRVQSILESLEGALRRFEPRVARIERQLPQYRNDFTAGLFLLLQEHDQLSTLYNRINRTLSKIAKSETVGTSERQDPRQGDEEGTGQPARVQSPLYFRPKYQFPDSDFDDSDSEEYSGALNSGPAGEALRAGRREWATARRRLEQTENLPRYWQTPDMRSVSDEDDVPKFSSIPSLASNQTILPDDHHSHDDTLEDHDHGPEPLHSRHSAAVEFTVDQAWKDNFDWGDFWDGTTLAREGFRDPVRERNRQVEAGPSTGPPEVEIRVPFASALGEQPQGPGTYGHLSRGGSAKPEVPYYQYGSGRYALEGEGDEGYDGFDEVEDEDDEYYLGDEDEDEDDHGFLGPRMHARLTFPGRMHYPPWQPESAAGPIPCFACSRHFEALDAADRMKISYSAERLSDDCGPRDGYPSITFEQKMALYIDWIDERIRAGEDSTVRAFEREILRRGLLAMFEDMRMRDEYRQRREEEDEAGPSRPHGGASGRSEAANVEEDTAEPAEQPEEQTDEHHSQPDLVPSHLRPESRIWVDEASTNNLIWEIELQDMTQEQRRAVREALRLRSGEGVGVPEQRKAREEARQEFTTTPGAPCASEELNAR
jgi:hypothetical protein